MAGWRPTRIHAIIRGMRIDLRGRSPVTSIATATGWVARFEGGRRVPVVCWGLTADELLPLIEGGTGLVDASADAYFQGLDPPALVAV